VTNLALVTAHMLAEACEGHAAHLAANGECPWCGAYSDMTEEETQAILTGGVASDEDAVTASGSWTELMRSAGVIELPDGHGWLDTGARPEPGAAWERHDDPGQTP
jgi:hypothetical protein